MALSPEVRRLQAKWRTNMGWPQRLKWIEINNIRGWTGQRISFDFPMVAIVGENGSGKSSIIQAAASVYRGSGARNSKFASDFFPVTAWEEISNAQVQCEYMQGQKIEIAKVRKPTSRWKGNPERPSRHVEYIDLSRIQPLSARVGYARIAKNRHLEKSAEAFDHSRVGLLSEIMGRSYDGAKMALTTIDDIRYVPVLTQDGVPYSGFHQGSGETTMAEFIKVDPPKYSFLAIDEIESSLHPRSQRRLVRILADICKNKEIQIVFTTHSPYILEELPPEARICILGRGANRKIVYGVSPEFAMNKMDDIPHHECELYVEDDAAKIMLSEILANHARDIVNRCKILPFGASNIGIALGQMITQGRYPRPAHVFLDGDSVDAPGCTLLPGCGDAPEIVVFGALSNINWGNLSDRVGRDFPEVADACSSAMTLGDHHEWIKAVATRLHLSGDMLWHSMCGEWSSKCLSPDEAANIRRPVENVLLQVS